MARPTAPSASVTCSDPAFLESVGITRRVLLGEELRETSAEEVRDLLAAPEVG